MSRCDTPRGAAPVHSQDVGGEWQLRGLGHDGAEHGPYGAVVPGDIHLDLLAAGRIPDPFFGEDYRQGLFAETVTWVYTRRFATDPALAECDRVELVFEGLDTFATVIVNGLEVARGDNMWIPLRVDVSPSLRYDGVNTLEVRFESPFEAVRDAVATDPTPGVNAFFTPKERIYTRKAQMSYGWDIAPRIVTCGIWRPVRIEGCVGAIVRDVGVRTRLAPEGAEIALTVAGVAVRECEDWSFTAVARCGESELVVNGPLERRAGELNGHAVALLPDPHLWWTWDTGRPELYDLEVTIQGDGQPLASWRGRFGIREVEVHLADESGRPRFYFTVNGRPTFMRGTNWIPLDAIFARVTAERLAGAMDLAEDLHCNMLRIWGGGIYEDPEFYDLCDERGILVWHDFMFACGVYPQTEEFLGLVRREAESVVRSLRNHPCLAIWSGDNECDCAYGWQTDGPSYNSNRITREVLPRAVSRLDPDRPYIPSSPCNPSGTGDPNGTEEGDSHVWSHNAPPRAPMYFQDTSKLLSEIGRICPANVESIRRFLPADAQWPHSNPVWDQHLGTIPTQDFHRRDRMDEALEAVLGAVPDTLEGYVEASQLLQAFCLSEWIERARRRKFECGGILWWNLIDNWPQHSDAVVDHYLARKIGYGAVKRASRLVAPSVESSDAGGVVWVLNDTDEEVRGSVSLDLRGVDGSGRELGCTTVAAKPNSSVVVLEVPRCVWDDADPNVHWLRAELTTDAGTLETRHVLDGCTSIDVLRKVYGEAPAG